MSIVGFSFFLLGVLGFCLLVELVRGSLGQVTCLGFPPSVGY